MYLPFCLREAEARVYRHRNSSSKISVLCVLFVGALEVSLSFFPSFTLTLFFVLWCATNLLSMLKGGGSERPPPLTRSFLYFPFPPPSFFLSLSLSHSFFLFSTPCLFTVPRIHVRTKCSRESLFVREHSWRGWRCGTRGPTTHVKCFKGYICRYMYINKGGELREGFRYTRSFFAFSSNAFYCRRIIHLTFAP